MLKHVVAVFMVLAFALSSPAFAEPAKEASIKTLMDRTGAGNLGIQVMRQMLDNMKKAMPDVPEVFWSDFMAEFDADSLGDKIVPIYQKHLTEEDVQGLITFYESPTGKKFISVMPVVARESMAVGQKWGESVALKVVEKLKARNREKKN